MRSNVVVESEVVRTFRVEQLAGMFDVSLEDRIRQEWAVELPIEDNDWLIGAIVGPSGSGKTRIAQAMFPKEYHRGFTWQKGKSVLDAFPPSMPVSEITAMLSAVGFSSPPSWVKPFDVLSNGEKFRAELARLLLQDKPLVVVDEFTSVVDRTVAQIGSAAINKAVHRRGRGKLIVLSCHYDILDWLAPDWIYDLRDRTFSWARLHRPAIELEIFRSPSSLWRLFAPYHYLNTRDLPTGHHYVATWNGQLVATQVVMPLIGRKGIWRDARCVVLPDFQGVGIGGKLSDAVGDMYLAKGYRYVGTSSHPARIAYMYSPQSKWRVTSIKKTGAAPQSGMMARMARERGHKMATSTGRAVVSSEYVGRTRADDQTPAGKD